MTAQKNRVTPFKIFLFILFFLTGISAIGTAFSHVWRISKQLSQIEQASQPKSEAAQPQVDPMQAVAEQTTESQ